MLGSPPSFGDGQVRSLICTHGTINYTLHPGVSAIGFTDGLCLSGLRIGFYLYSHASS